MRVVFMGTPVLAATVLAGLVEADTVEVVSVFTRPDAVRGRGKKLVGSPVKEYAERMGLPVFTPRTLKDDDVVEQIRAFNPDAICVAAYGMILPKVVLDIPPLGCFNVHSSLLPRWRGAAPIERAILAGDESTGVCIMKMEEGLDTGPYCTQEEVFTRGKTLEVLSSELASLGANLLVASLQDAESGGLHWEEQSREGVTYAAKIEKGELDPDPGDSVDLVSRKILASSPAHPAKAVVAGKSVTLIEARITGEQELLDADLSLAPGEVAYSMKRLFAGAADGCFEILRVKPDGKKEMDAKSFAAGIQGIKNMKAMWGTR